MNIIPDFSRLPVFSFGSTPVLQKIAGYSRKWEMLSCCQNSATTKEDLVAAGIGRLKWEIGAYRI